MYTVLGLTKGMRSSTSPTARQSGNFLKGLVGRLGIFSTLQRNVKLPTPKSRYGLN